MSKKIPKKIEFPQSGKPKKSENPDSFDHMYISWGISLIENDGNWGWSVISIETWNSIIFPKLKNIETMTWQELKNNKKHNHSIAIGDIDTEAQKYLAKMKLDDHDRVFSIRLDGKKRIIGLRYMSVLKILWYDPNHEICPSKKKRT